LGFVDGQNFLYGFCFHQHAIFHQIEQELTEEAETPLQSPLSSFPPVKFLEIHSFSKAKIFFQSFFMLITIQPFFFASS
jgi:hypothetical protein